MENRNLKWSQIFPLSDSKCLPDLRSKTGVYRIRAFTEHEEPLHINRFAGVDEFGILHIGESGNLTQRIEMFRNGVEKQKFGHKAANEFFEWNFKKLVPVERLRFDYIKTPDKQSAVELERSLHKEYREKFLDRSPLDGTSGRTNNKTKSKVSDSAPLIQTSLTERKKAENIEKHYGVRKQLYKVFKKDNGRIDLYVCHENKMMLETIKEHKGKPSYFIRRYEAFKKSNIKAQSWLAKVINNYCSHFESDRVDIILS